MIYLLAKTLHIIGFTAWFAGMFYLGRIFVYHREALEGGQPSELYETMEVRAYHIICHPAMIITWLCGLTMIWMNGLEWLSQNGWLQIKLLLILLLTLYHLSLKGTIKGLKNRSSTISSFRFRLLNEVPTLFLFAIIPFAVFKNGVNATFVVLGIILLMVLLYSATKFYKRYRDNRS